MKKVTVIPIYGYGWRANKQLIEVPPLFSVQVSRFDSALEPANYSWIAGCVSQPEHEFDGLWILISLRHRGASPTYNVFLYKDKPAFITGGTLEPFSTHTVVSGFANLYFPGGVNT